MKHRFEAEVFIGVKGLRTAYEKLFAGLNKEEEHVFFYVHKKEYADEADNFYFSISDILKKAKMRAVSNSEARKSEFMKKVKYISSRYVNFPIPGNWEANRDMLLIVSWTKPVIGILIKSKSIVDEFKNYFESVWKVAKP